MSSATARLNIGHQTGIILLGAVVTIAAAKVPPLPPPKKKSTSSHKDYLHVQFAAKKLHTRTKFYKQTQKKQYLQELSANLQTLAIMQLLSHSQAVLRGY